MNEINACINNIPIIDNYDNTFIPLMVREFNGERIAVFINESILEIDPDNSEVFSNIINQYFDGYIELREYSNKFNINNLIPVMGVIVVDTFYLILRDTITNKYVLTYYIAQVGGFDTFNLDRVVFNDINDVIAFITKELNEEEIEKFAIIGVVFIDKLYTC